MKTFGSILSKVLVIIATLSVTISLTIFPLFSWGLPLKNNIAVIITLLVNQNPLTSDLYKQLMASSNIITDYLAGGLLLFNLTYLVVLVFVKKPFSKALIAIYMFLMTLILTAFVLIIYNVFNFTYFQTIPFNNLWTIPLAGLGLSFLTIFWYGLRNLWVNPRTLVGNQSLTDSPENDEEQVSYEDLQNQLKQLKSQLKEVRNVERRKKSK
ncbi:hypothetical protein [Spiroplasma endosymbiont of Virgichneumon dumeticola]|uniref:hypothetical protein n=1 Tax=Spiroplasma endosymbiont of Virgichneumon dumeticola TaxID=3139323 RepID=UPI0035C94216